MSGSLVGSALSAAADLLLGAGCHGCGAPGWGVCDGCRTDLDGRRPYATRPVPCPAGFPLTVASSPYDPLVRRMIIAHKERQALSLSTLLGARLALSVAEVLRLSGRTAERAVVLVPVPSAARAVRARGLDATSAMARAAARDLSGSASRSVRSVPALAQTRAVRDQAGLSAEQRRRNLAGGFRLRRDLAGALVVVVDDVMTTGSSIEEATRVLRSADAVVIGAATVAATVRLRTPHGSG